MGKIGFVLLLLFLSCKNESKSTDRLSANEQNETIKKGDEKATASTPFDLEVYDYEGLEPFLTTTSDKTYVVNFWATWCAPCIKEMPYFEKLNSNYADKKVEVILVSLDFPNKYDSNLNPFIKDQNLKSKVIALNDTDSNTWIPKISEDWSGAIPATLIYNKDKRQFYEQSFTYGELETEVKQFLK